jgi:putative oxidoreductase
MKDIADLIARGLIACIFLYEAYDSIIFFKSTKVTMEEYGITWNQDMLLLGAIFLLLVGGILVLIGYHPNFGAILLLLYWVPVTFIVYSFWNDPPGIRRINSVMFMKNLAIIGGLLFVFVNGTGKYSVKRLLHVLRLPK